MIYRLLIRLIFLVIYKDMVKIEKQKYLTKKRTFTKNTWYDWYDWLINNNPEAIKKLEAGLKANL